jgi:glycosyltransferase involved in cell wall biosynthesis
MRVCICRSNSVSPDPRVEKEARALVKAKHSVQVVGWNREGIGLRSILPEGWILNVLPVYAPYRRGLWNITGFLKWQWSLFFWLLKNRNHYDVIHACNFDTMLAAFLAGKMIRKKLVYDIFDFLADSAQRVPSKLRKIIRWLDLKLIENSDAVILVDEARKEQVSEAKIKRVAYIYNSPEDEYTRFNQQADKLCSFHITYVGQLEYRRGMQTLLSLVEEHPEWYLDLAGVGRNEEEIRQQALRINNINWHGRVLYSKAIELNAKADTLIATYDPTTPNHRYSSANKIFEAMMLGKPIIVARDTNMDKIIEEEDCGLVVPYDDKEALEKAFLYLSDHPEVARRLGENGRKAYESKYSWDIMASRLQQIYSELLDNQVILKQKTERFPF